MISSSKTWQTKELMETYKKENADANKLFTKPFNVIYDDDSETEMDFVESKPYKKDKFINAFRKDAEKFRVENFEEKLKNYFMYDTEDEINGKLIFVYEMYNTLPIDQFNNWFDNFVSLYEEDESEDDYFDMIDSP